MDFGKISYRLSRLAKEMAELSRELKYLEAVMDFTEEEEGVEISQK